MENTIDFDVDDIAPDDLDDMRGTGERLEFVLCESVSAGDVLTFCTSNGHGNKHLRKRTMDNQICFTWAHRDMTAGETLRVTLYEL